MSRASWTLLAKVSRKTTSGADRRGKSWDEAEVENGKATRWASTGHREKLVISRNEDFDPQLDRSSQI